MGTTTVERGIEEPTGAGRHDLERLLTPKELAEYLGVAQQTVYNWNYSGRGPRALRAGAGPKSRVRYRLSDVLAWLERSADPAA